MNGWWMAAAALLTLIGLVHSMLGERMIFRHLRAGGLVPQGGGPVLRSYQTRILWASWHLVTLLGWGLAALLLWLGQPAARAASAGQLEAGIAIVLALGGSLVLWSNRGRHPGWLAPWTAAALVTAGHLNPQ